MTFLRQLIDSGTITSPKGFQAGAVCAGIKSKDKLDLALLYSEAPAVAAGLFTKNKIKAAPVILSQRNLQSRRARAILVNSGCANACTGEQGIRDASEMASLTARKLGILPEEVLVASTGVIGVPLPVESVREGIEKISLSRDDGHALTEAMMTSDTFPKEVAILVTGEEQFIIGGVAKGAGMIHPDLATLLCFLTTDAKVEADFLKSSLQKAVDISFNMVTIDGETSPSDSAFLLANGLAGNRVFSGNNGEAFQEALNEVCVYLSKSIARDGEGATKFIEVVVEGAVNEAEARQAARTIASSPLVKSAIHGSDPNWGRVVAALGRSGVEVTESKLDLYMNHFCVMRAGSPVPFSKKELIESLNNKEIVIRLNLNIGKGRAIAWGCDLSEEYVTINSAYTT